MNGKQFIKRTPEWAKANNLEFLFRSDLGKGGHQVVYVGDRLTIVKSGEIGVGLLHAMLRQLNIPKQEF